MSYIRHQTQQFLQSPVWSREPVRKLGVGGGGGGASFTPGGEAFDLSHRKG